MNGTIPDLLTRFVQEIANNPLTNRALYERLAETARELVEASSACVLEIVDQGFRVAATAGDPRPFDWATFSIAPAPVLVREVLDSRRARYTNHTAHDPHADPRRQQPLNARQLALAPILLAGDVVGLLACINTAHGAFTDADLALLEHLALHGTMVLRSNALVRQADAVANDTRAHDAARAARAAHVNAVLLKTARAGWHDHARVSLSWTGRHSRAGVARRRVRRLRRRP